MTEEDKKQSDDLTKLFLKEFLYTFDIDAVPIEERKKAYYDYYEDYAFGKTMDTFGDYEDDLQESLAEGYEVDNIPDSEKVYATNLSHCLLV